MEQRRRIPQHRQHPVHLQYQQQVGRCLQRDNHQEPGRPVVDHSEEDLFHLSHPIQMGRHPAGEPGSPAEPFENGMKEIGPAGKGNHGHQQDAAQEEHTAPDRRPQRGFQGEPESQDGKTSRGNGHRAEVVEEDLGQGGGEGLVESQAPPLEQPGLGGFRQQRPGGGQDPHGFAGDSNPQDVPVGHLDSEQTAGEGRGPHGLVNGVNARKSRQVPADLEQQGENAAGAEPIDQVGRQAQAQQHQQGAQPSAAGS